MKEEWHMQKIAFRYIFSGSHNVEDQEWKAGKLSKIQDVFPTRSGQS